MKRSSVLALFFKTFATVCIFATSNALAQKANDSIRKDPISAYKTIYEIVRQIPLSRVSNPAHYRNPTLGDYIAIGPCDVGSTIFGIAEGPLKRALFDLATEIWFARESFIKADYPKRIWLETTANEESKALQFLIKQKYPDEAMGEYIYNKLRQNLSSEITKNIKQRNLKLAPASPAECGGGPVTFRLDVSPKGRSVELIPKMLWIFCEKTGVDPRDKSRCDLWLAPAKNGEELELGGVYKYKNESGKYEELDTDRYTRGKGDVYILKVDLSK